MVSPTRLLLRSDPDGISSKFLLAEVTIKSNYLCWMNLQLIPCPMGILEFSCWVFRIYNSNFRMNRKKNNINDGQLLFRTLFLACTLSIYSIFGILLLLGIHIGTRLALEFNRRI